MVAVGSLCAGHLFVFQSPCLGLGLGALLCILVGCGLILVSSDVFRRVLFLFVFLVASSFFFSLSPLARDLLKLQLARCKNVPVARSTMSRAGLGQIQVAVLAEYLLVRADGRHLALQGGKYQPGSQGYCCLPCVSMR